MQRSIIRITETFLENLRNRNLYGLLPLFAEEVDWYIPGDVKRANWVGSRVTKDEIATFFQLLWQATHQISAVIYDILYGQNTSIITGEFTTRMLATDQVVNSLFFIYIKEESEHIAYYRLLEDTHAVACSLIPKTRL